VRTSPRRGFPTAASGTTNEAKRSAKSSSCTPTKASRKSQTFTGSVPVYRSSADAVAQPRISPMITSTARVPLRTLEIVRPGNRVPGCASRILSNHRMSIAGREAGAAPASSARSRLSRTATSASRSRAS
jgi:hypothetical protein